MHSKTDLTSPRLLAGKGLALHWMLLITLSILASAAAEPASQRSKIDFNRDIKPILSDHCYACHGPDEKKRKAGLRLDLQDPAFEPAKSGKTPIVAGSVSTSEVFHRITSADPEEKMPPDKGAKPISTAQIALLKKWIEEGAQWQGHWAYTKPQQPEIPRLEKPGRVLNPIDSFIQKRLEKEGLFISQEADRNRLLRRVTLDLTGLPPTPDEIKEFLADKSTDAYEKVVDRLLKSSHYGERMVMFWLDLARFADTQGYHHDDHRDMYHWRDWAIKSFNENMPFDQFTIEQLAGDLLPNPTREQKIATGFHRNEMTTSEGGAMPEEYAVKYVSGRVDTTARVWLGTSMACAECHDHKYDPISQKEFYQMFAYFNNIPENGLDASRNPVPRIPLSSHEQINRLEEFNREVGNLEKLDKSLLEDPHADRDKEFATWLSKIEESAASSKWSPLEPSGASATNGTTLSIKPDSSIQASGQIPAKDVYNVTLNAGQTELTGIRIEALPEDSPSGKRKSGRGEKGDFILTRITAKIQSTSPQPPRPPQATNLSPWHLIGPFSANSNKEALDKKFGPEEGYAPEKSFVEGRIKWQDIKSAGDSFTLSGTNTASYLHRKLHFDQDGYLMLEVGENAGLKLQLNGRVRYSWEPGPESEAWTGKIPIQVKAGENDLLLKVVPLASARFNISLLDAPVTEFPVEFAAAAADFNGGGYQVSGVLDDRNTTGWSAGSDEGQTTKPHSAFLRTHEPFGFKGGSRLVLRLSFDSPTPNQALARFRVSATTTKSLSEFFELPDSVRSAFLAKPSERSRDQSLELQRHFRRTFIPEIKEWAKTLGEKRKQRDDYKGSLPVTMVMEEMQKPRDSFVLVRGEFHNRGEKVRPGVPSHIMPMPEGYPENRLGLAKWLVHPENPLTARVTVNHFWHQYFGTGIVKTAEEFGSQGEWPSHPELLDWLSTEFVKSGWNVKSLQRLIVTSATYRQSAAISRELSGRDPENRLLSHFPRIRLEAETIRDHALTVSGLINLKIGGPSVYPFQPPGMWEAVAFEGTRSWAQSAGDENYRRGIYTYWRRSIPYPSFVTFDAPTRETCTVKRPRTNTPLQALVLMNDPVYVEAARAFGQRILLKGGASLKEKLDYAFLTSLGRSPTTRERRIMESAFTREFRRFSQDRVAAAKLTSIGVSKPSLEVDISELAAWTILGSTLLNLDEAVNKG